MKECYLSLGKILTQNAYLRIQTVEIRIMVKCPIPKILKVIILLIEIIFELETHFKSNIFEFKRVSYAIIRACTKHSWRFELGIEARIDRIRRISFHQR